MVYCQLKEEDREIIATMTANGSSQVKIAQSLGRPACTISRELRRNGPKGSYVASVAQGLSDRRRAKAARGRRKMEQPEIRAEVKEQLQEDWSPEQIAGERKRRLPPDSRVRISRQTIYNSIDRDDHALPLKKCLRRYRRRKRRRVKRERTCPGLTHRPGVINCRGRYGDWEGDTIVSAGHRGAALITLVERKSRFTLMIPVPNLKSRTVCRAIYRRFKKLPAQLRLSLTLDNGKEFAAWKELQRRLGIEIYFTDPRSPWQRGTNENTNGLVRQYFPKGTYFSQVSRYQVRKIQAKLNHRPRKRLDFQTPYEIFHHQCCLALQT
jgi:IS30 family transposase